MPAKRRNRITLRSIIRSVGWIVVLISALAISFWSLYFVGRHYGLPVPLALLVSACFDGGAVVAGDISLRYAQTHGDSGLSARIALFGFAGSSVYLNIQHAIMANDAAAARVLYGAPPLIAVSIIELHSRWERRGALRKAGRVAKSIPVFGRWSWLLFPVRTLGTLRLVIAHRLRTTANAEVPGISIVSNDYPDVSPAIVRAWARDNGMTISDRARIPGSIRDAYHAANSGREVTPGFGVLRLTPIRDANAALTSGNVSRSDDETESNQQLTEPNDVEQNGA